MTTKALIELALQAAVPVVSWHTGKVASMMQTSGTCPPLSGNTILRKPKKGKR